MQEFLSWHSVCCLCSTAFLGEMAYHLRALGSFRCVVAICSGSEKVVEVMV